MAFISLTPSAARPAPVPARLRAAAEKPDAARFAFEDLLKTLSDQYSLKYDGDKVAEMGKLIPAKLAVFTHVGGGGKDRVEVLIKLVRLETGEILSLSLLKIEEWLPVARKK